MASSIPTASASVSDASVTAGSQGERARRRGLPRWVCGTSCCSSPPALCACRLCLPGFLPLPSPTAGRTPELLLPTCEEEPFGAGQIAVWVVGGEDPGQLPHLHKVAGS